VARLTVGHENGQDIDLHFDDVGSGEPVVLIHGWPLSGRSWEPQIAALVEAGYRAISYDRRGFGLSSQPWEGYDYDTLTADLHALLEHLDLRGATLVGFSMGGGEVARYVATHRTVRVSRAVFAAAVPPFLHKSGENPDGAVDDATVNRYLNAVREDRPAFLDEFMTDFFTVGDRTDLVSVPAHAYNVGIAEFASPHGTLECIRTVSYTDFRSDLEQFDIPTLVIHGDSDVIVPFEVAGQRTHETISGSQLALIEAAPHGLNLTHAEQFNRALLDFLRS
jgi:non-heme chloroperoxidase